MHYACEKLSKVKGMLATGLATESWNTPTLLILYY